MSSRSSFTKSDSEDTICCTTFEQFSCRMRKVLPDVPTSELMPQIQQEFNNMTGLDLEKRRQVIDQVIREKLLYLLAESASPEDCESVIELSINMARAELCPSTAPSVLLSDLYDSLTTDKCEELFHLVENRVRIWKEPIFFNPCKNNLLRLCNDLLRRLSQSQNTVFCGRILMFLAKFFPFSERSGLNIASEFNIDNVTAYSKDADSEGDIVIEDESDHEEEVRKPVDYQLYSKFWHLQDHFRSPNQCYSKAEWKVYTKNAEEVLNCFEGYKLSILGLQKSKKLPSPESDAMEVDSKEQQYFAKYLSNRKLLDLQLSDSNFRRYILVQFLIVHQYLTTSVKYKSDGQVLSEEQSAWVEKTNNKVYKLIEETPPDGKKFAEGIKHILKREEHWNSWKNEGCKAFEKPGNSSEERPPQPKRKRKQGDVISCHQANKKLILGMTAMNNLWNVNHDNLEACKGEDSIPSLQDYFQDAIEEADPKSGIEPQHKRVNDMDYSWRALRLLAKRSPLFFELRTKYYDRTSDYVESIITKISKDFPQNKEESSEEAVADEEEELEAETESQDATPITKEQISQLSQELGENWKKLAPKLGFEAEQIEQFFGTSENAAEQGENMLLAWLEQEKDAAVTDEIKYCLKGLKLESVCQTVFGEG